MEKEGIKIDELIITGYYNPSNNTFTIKKNGSYVPGSLNDPNRKGRIFRLIRTFFKDRADDIAFTVNLAVKRTQLKFIKAREGIGIPLFCDSEGKIYFFDDQSVLHFISEDNQFSLSEIGEFYRITQVEDGFVLDKLLGFNEAFPFKMVSKPKVDEFDFGDDIDDDYLEDDDPFAEKPNPKKSNVIDFEAAKFLRERDGRGR